jgi:beta-phosphoglucomutase
MYKGIIFDFNGTLLWDTEFHNRAWDIFLKRYHVHLHDDEKQLRLHGKNNAQLIADLFPQHISREESLEIAREKERYYQRLVVSEGLRLAEGTTELFDRLKLLGCAFTIVTASDAINVDFYFNHYSLGKWFSRDQVVYSDGKIRPKPHPDMFLEAMERMKIVPQETIIFEDSDTGLLAAQKSGAGKIIIVNSTNRSYEDWPYDIIRSFHEIGAEELIQGIR